MATKQDIRNEGFRRGQAVASWVDMPEIGTELSPAVDWVGYRTVTEANQFHVWEMLCGEAARRQFQREPYKVEAWDMLLREARTKPYDVWEVFEAGIQAGIAAYGRRHHATELANASTEGV